MDMITADDSCWQISVWHY